MAQGKSFRIKLLFELRAANSSFEYGQTIIPLNADQAVEPLKGQAENRTFGFRHCQVADHTGQN